VPKYHCQLELYVNRNCQIGALAQAQGEGACAQVPHMGTTLKPILSPYGTLVCLFGGASASSGDASDTNAR